MSSFDSTNVVLNFENILFSVIFFTVSWKKELTLLYRRCLLFHNDKSDIYISQGPFVVLFFMGFLDDPFNRRLSLGVQCPLFYVYGIHFSTPRSVH